MTLLVLLLVPLFAAAVLGFVGDRKFAPEINILGSAATFVASIELALRVYEQGPILAGNNFFFVDAFSVYLTVLTSFVSMTTAIFSRRYMRREREHGTIGHRRMRFYHSMFQLFIFAMLLCLLTNNVGVLWIAMELATLSTVLLVSLYRTPTAIEAAWKYFILCGVGIAQALFGTVLLYFAAERVFGEGSAALLRCKVLVDGATHSHKAGHIMMAFGLISILVSAFSLLRQKDIKRMFAYSSIEHMGIATFAFGLGGPVAAFGGLLHMLVHSLTKSSIFFAAGHASQMHDTQEMSGIKGLIRGNPLAGWGLMLGCVAIAGMPPFGVFTSEFLILTATIKNAPFLTPVFLLGIAVAFAALFGKVMPMAFGHIPENQRKLKLAHFPVIVHMALVLVIGLYLPGFLSNWFHRSEEHTSELQSPK